MAKLSWMDMNQEDEEARRRLDKLLSTEEAEQLKRREDLARMDAELAGNPVEPVRIRDILSPQEEARLERREEIVYAPRITWTMPEGIARGTEGQPWSMEVNPEAGTVRGGLRIDDSRPSPLHMADLANTGVAGSGAIGGAMGSADRLRRSLGLGPRQRVKEQQASELQMRDFAENARRSNLDALTALEVAREKQREVKTAGESFFVPEGVQGRVERPEPKPTVVSTEGGALVGDPTRPESFKYVSGKAAIPPGAVSLRPTGVEGLYYFTDEQGKTTIVQPKDKSASLAEQMMRMQMYYHLKASDPAKAEAYFNANFMPRAPAEGAAPTGTTAGAPAGVAGKKNQIPEYEDEREARLNGAKSGDVVRLRSVGAVVRLR